MKKAPDTIDFGFETIPLEEKQGRVNHVFNGVASKYDLMNDVLSLRMHRVWKESLITKLRLPKGEHKFAHLDVAGGTGDIVARALAHAGSGYAATLLDINEAMLREAAIRFDLLPPCFYPAKLRKRSMGGGAVTRSVTEGGESSDLGAEPPSASFHSAAPPQGGSRKGEINDYCPWLNVRHFGGCD